jgi:hypothetical protein
VGAQIRITTRKIWISMGSGHPGARVFAQVYDHLNGLAPMRE